MNVVLPLLGAGVLLVGTLAFWAAMQNWIADVIHHARQRLGDLVAPVETALVLLDRAIVNGQRVISMTARAIFHQNDERVIAQEVRQIDPQALPGDILNRLNGLPEGQTLSYEMTVGREKHVTRRLEVKRAD
jgi:hypothetical protein